jgi:hypothetical protein
MMLYKKNRKKCWHKMAILTLSAFAFKRKEKGMCINALKKRIHIRVGA